MVVDLSYGLTRAIHSSMMPILHPNRVCPAPSPRAAIICSQLQPAVSRIVKCLRGPTPYGAMVSKVLSLSTKAKRFTPRLTVGTDSGITVFGQTSAVLGTPSPSSSRDWMSRTTLSIWRWAGPV